MAVGFVATIFGYEDPQGNKDMTCGPGRANKGNLAPESIKVGKLVRSCKIETIRRTDTRDSHATLDKSDHS